MDIYREELIEHYRHPQNFGRLSKPTVWHEEGNPFCGDKIRMELEIKNDQVENVAFSGIGCVISLASASLLTENIKGKKISEVKKIEMRDIIKLLGIELSPTRLKCGLLPWEVLEKAISKRR